MSALALLSGDKQTFGELPENDAHDPQRSLTRFHLTGEIRYGK